MVEFRRREMFCPRPAISRGIVEHADWRLKAYDISFDNRPPGEADYREGVALALGVLPHPAAGADRPGVGVLIRHSGAQALYVVVAWWDNQNELLNRVFVRDLTKPTPWRDAHGAFSFCVWDLQVLWHERCAYVRWVLSPPAGPDIAAYLRDMAADPVC